LWIRLRRISGPTHFDIRSCSNRSVCVGPRTTNPARIGPVHLGRGVRPAGRPIWPKGRDLARCRHLFPTIFGLGLVKKGNQRLKLNKHNNQVRAGRLGQFMATKKYNNNTYKFMHHGHESWLACSQTMPFLPGPKHSSWPS
jgi:hypothetical protein